MDLIQGLLLITSIHLLAAASPGPDFVLVSQQTLINGRRAGLMCSFGISLGLSVHILYSAFGLAAVIASSISALWAIKIFGGSYLIYLGIKGIRSKSANNSEQNNDLKISKSSLKIIAAGFLCNVLNPKAPIYFISLFTIVLSPDMPLYHIAIYGLWMMCIQLIWFSLVAILLSNPAINRKFKSFSHWIDRVLGVAMIGLGLKIIATRTN
jgi:threonine efflux protein